LQPWLNPPSKLAAWETAPSEGGKYWETSDEERSVFRQLVWGAGNKNDILFKVPYAHLAHDEVKRKTVQAFQPNTWLTDESLNLYGDLVKVSFDVVFGGINGLQST
jgi:hypothetical protein